MIKYFNGLCFALLIMTQVSHAQSVRYMDNSGNIHFVDNLSDVPARYRQQVVPPTPTPILDKRGLQEKRRLELQAKRQAAEEQRREKLEEQRKRREEYQSAKKEQERLKKERIKSGFQRNM